MAIRSSTPPRNGAHYRSHHHQRQPLDDASTHSDSSSTSSSANSSHQQQYVHNYKKRSLPCKSLYVAMDCEMVQGAISGQSLCARVVLCDWKGRTIYDTYCTPTEPVSDYRTFVSGITPADLKNAPSFAFVRRNVQRILCGQSIVEDDDQDSLGIITPNMYKMILVGHALQNDLECLHMTEYPWQLMRDTALYQPFQRFDQRLQCHVPRKLRDLVLEKKLSGFTDSFQQATHDPQQDAMAALLLYKQHRPRWEACMASEVQRYEQEHNRQRQQQQLLRLQQQQQVQYYVVVPSVHYVPQRNPYHGYAQTTY